MRLRSHLTLIVIGALLPVISLITLLGALADHPLRSWLWLLIGTAALMVLVGAGLVLVIGRRLEQLIRWLVVAAPRLARGEPITALRSSVDELDAVADAMETASRELHHARRAAVALARISQAFTGRPDVAAVGRQIVENVLAAFDAASANLHLLGADGSLTTLAQHGIGMTAELAHDVVPLGMGISGLAVSSGGPVLTENILEDRLTRLTEGVRRMMVEPGLTVWLAVPLRVNDRPIGALSIGDRTGRRFSSAEVTLLQTFGDQAALALHQAQRFEETEHRRRTAEALAEVGRLISETLDPRVVGSRIVDSVQNLLAVRSAILYSLDPSTGGFSAHTISSDVAGVFTWTPRLEPGVGAASLAVEQRCPVMASDVLADPRLVYPPEMIDRIEPSAHRALLAVPLRLQDRVIGALVVADKTGRLYDARDAELAQAFAAQAAIALDNADLYQDLQRAYDDLSHTQAQLAQAQKMEAVGHLAGGIAHEFNNLLTVVLGRCALLLDQVGPADPVRMSLEGIHRAADRAATLTRQLLAFSRRQVLQPTRLDLNVVVTGFAPICRSLLGESIEVTVLPAAGPLFVRADQGQLEQVLVSLVANARDATPRGGRCTLRTAAVTLGDDRVAPLTALPPGSYGTLAITDTGHGMSPDVLARVFDPFFTTKGVGQGTGLGLSMAHGLIAQHGGTITVESQEGVGSTFTIYLPEPAPDDSARPAHP